MLPTWLPLLYSSPAKIFRFPFIQLGPKERRGQLSLSGGLGIGCVAAWGHSKVRDTELQSVCLSFCPSVMHIPELFLTSDFLIQFLFYILSCSTMFKFIWRSLLLELAGVMSGQQRITCFVFICQPSN